MIQKNLNLTTAADPSLQTENFFVCFIIRQQISYDIKHKYKFTKL